MISYKQPKRNEKYSSSHAPEQYLHEYENMSEEEKHKTIQNPGHVDEGKWEKAKEASMKEYGEHRWPAIMYIYEKMGGR